jgi:hypothetical protein
MSATATTLSVLLLICNIVLLLFVIWDNVFSGSSFLSKYSKFMPQIFAMIYVSYIIFHSYALVKNNDAVTLFIITNILSGCVMAWVWIQRSKSD